MNRNSDLDRLLETWLDGGADVAPEQFVWAALDKIETTPQRGVLVTSLEGFLMRLQPAAPLLGLAAVAIAAIALFAALIAPNVGSTVPSPRAVTRTSSPR